jgi:hypothetical protein
MSALAVLSFWSERMLGVGVLRLKIGLVGGCGGRGLWVIFLGWIWGTFPEIVRIEAEVHDFKVGVGGIEEGRFENEGT